MVAALLISFNYESFPHGKQPGSSLKDLAGYQGQGLGFRGLGV